MLFKLKNFDIDKFNRDVNQSLGPDAQFERWAGYRTRVAEFIGDKLKDAADAKSAVVFGAGNLNDLDMRFLCGRFDKIVLSDADTKSIRDGLMRHGLTDGEIKKVETVQADYAGAQKSGLFEGLESLAGRAAPADELAGYIQKAISEMEPDARMGKHDVVISCPVYTQLVYTQIEVFLKILHEYGLYEYQELNRMLNAAYREMPGVLGKYNDALIAACKEGGHIIVLADMLEMKAGSPLFKKTFRLMEGEPLDSGKIEKHLKKNGIELARLGLQDFGAKTEKVASFFAIWPFSGEKEYLTCGVYAKNAIL